MLWIMRWVRADNDGAKKYLTSLEITMAGSKNYKSLLGDMRVLGLCTYLEVIVISTRQQEAYRGLVLPR